MRLKPEWHEGLADEVVLMTNKCLVSVVKHGCFFASLRWFFKVNSTERFFRISLWMRKLQAPDTTLAECSVVYAFSAMRYLSKSDIIELFDKMVRNSCQSAGKAQGKLI